MYYKVSFFSENDGIDLVFNYSFVGSFYIFQFSGKKNCLFYSKKEV